MRTRRDFSRSGFGILAVIATAWVGIQSASDGDWGIAAFFAISFLVCAIGVERTSRPKDERPISRLFRPATGSGTTAPGKPLGTSRGWMLFLLAFVIGAVLHFTSGRLFVAWFGFVVAGVAVFYFVHPDPARLSWDGEQWLREPGADRGLLGQRMLAGVAFLIGVGAIVVAAINFGTFST